MTVNNTVSKRRRFVASLPWLAKKARHGYTDSRPLTTEEKLRVMDRLIDGIKKNAEEAGITLDVKED